MDYSIVAPIGTLIAGVVYAVRQEGRINTHVAEDKVIHEQVKEALDGIAEKLDKIFDQQLTAAQTATRRANRKR